MPKDTRYRIIYVGKNRRVLDTATGQTMSYGTYVRHVKSAPTSIAPKLPYLSITMTEEYHNPSMEADVLLLAKEARKLTALELQHEVANMEYADQETGNEGIDASVIPVPQRIQALLPKEKPHG
ncbi:hypothetical protein, partial [Geobacter sp.]|uniref:hypothetical protein n=1 Tax=Geobacter sp. TaxID=46610 RepID=UPI002631EF2E